MPLQVKNWAQFFEGAKSKGYSKKSSCQMPNKFGLGYNRLTSMNNGAALFGAWCALVQVLSRHETPREGWITHSGRPDDAPYTAEDLELMTNLPEPLFEELFAVCVGGRIDWIKDSGGASTDTKGVSTDTKAVATDTARIPQEHGKDTTGNHADTRYPLNSDSDLTQTQTQPPTPKGAGSRSKQKTEDAEFDAFWAEYPAKAKKPDAIKAWRQVEAERSADGQAEVLEGLRRWKRSEQWTKDGGRFVPLPATWLRGWQWRDVPKGMRNAEGATRDGERRELPAGVGRVADDSENRMKPRLMGEQGAGSMEQGEMPLARCAR